MFVRPLDHLIHQLIECVAGCPNTTSIRMQTRFRLRKGNLLFKRATPQLARLLLHPTSIPTSVTPTFQMRATGSITR